MAGRWSRPVVTGARKKTIDQRNEQRDGGKRPEQSVGPEQPELHVPGAERDERREQHPARARIRRRPRIRDHEKREEQERPVLEAMDRNGQRLAEPDRSSEDEREVTGGKHICDVTARRSIDDKAAETGHQEREERHAAPLPGRDPHLTCRQHHRDDAEVGRVEQMFAAPADDELAGDGDDAGDDGDFWEVRTEQEAERQA